MALRVRRGTDAQRLAITPLAGELIFTTDTLQLFTGDGTTVGGIGVSAGAVSFSGIASDVTPDADNVRDIGAVGNRFAEGRFVNLFGALTGNVTGNLTGTVTGNTAGVHTGAVTGAVTGNVTGNLTGNVIGNVTGNITGNVTGNVAGSVIAADTTVLLNSVTKEAIVNSISSTFSCVLQPNSGSILDPVVLGSASDPSGLYIYSRNDGTGGAEGTLTISGSSQGLTAGSRMVFETTGSTGTPVSPTNIQTGDGIGSIEFRGLINGTDYVVSALMLSEAITIGASAIQGNMFTAVADSSGGFKRFNMAGNGAFNALSAIFGVSGESATPGLSNIPTGVALDVRGITKLEIRTAPPASPVNGMITIQDGATWDPAGTGVQAVVAYINGGWVKLN